MVAPTIWIYTTHHKSNDSDFQICISYVLHNLLDFEQYDRETIFAKSQIPLVLIHTLSNY